MNKLSFSVLFRLGILLFVSAWGSASYGDEIQYATGFTPEKSVITLGEPIYLTFNLTNTGSNRIMMSVDGIQWDEHGAFHIQAFDDNGLLVTNSRDNRIFAFSTIGGMTAIEPGGVYVDRLYLPTFIKFKQPGEYTVVVSRRLDFVKLTGTPNLIRSGSLSSRDKLNLVDDFLPITPEGSWIINFASTHSTSHITNRFNLTVLPTDKERLLKRAQEMLAKLDGIGARDVVAKTNGPRALNKMDWETAKSAWLVGQDNVDLAWAVRVLSDIGDQRIIPDLKQHLNDNSMKVRFACAKVLCALGESLRAEWIVPIIKSRQWSLDDDPEIFVAEHGGADAANILNMCLDTDPSLDGDYPGVWNTRLTNVMKNTGIRDAHPR